MKTIYKKAKKVEDHQQLLSFKHTLWPSMIIFIISAIMKIILLKSCTKVHGFYQRTSLNKIKLEKKSALIEQKQVQVTESEKKKHVKRLQQRQIKLNKLQSEQIKLQNKKQNKYLCKPYSNHKKSMSSCPLVRFAELSCWSFFNFIASGNGFNVTR